MKTLQSPLILLSILVLLLSRSFAQEILPMPRKPIPQSAMSINITEVIDARFLADPAFAGIVETGVNLVKKPAFFYRPLADILDSVQKSIPRGQATSPSVSVSITRLGFRENNSSTSETATLVAEFEFFSPDKAQLLGRQQVSLSYKGRDVTDKHSENVIAAFVQAIGAFSLQMNPNGTGEPVSGDHFSSFVEKISIGLRDSVLKEGVYASYENFLHNNPDQPIAFERKGQRNLLLYTFEGKTRPVEEDDPIWGAYHKGQLYLFDWGIFFPAYMQDAHLLFVGINTKSQSLPLGVAAGELSAEGVSTIELRRPFVLDWQTGGYYQDSSFVKSEIILLKKTPILLPGRRFNIVDVIDARYKADSAFVGVIQTGAFNVNKPAALEKSLSASTLDMIREQVPFVEGSLPVVLRITRLGIWERTTMSNEWAYVVAEFEFITKEGGRNNLLHREKVFLASTGVDVTKKHARHILEAIVQALSRFSDTLNAGLDSKGAAISSEIAVPDIPPILATNEWKSGIYMTFDEFYHNAPSQPVRFSILYGLQRLMITTNKGKTRPLHSDDTVWGFYDDGKLYLNQGGTFFPLTLKESELSFEGYDVMSRNNKAALAGVAFGLVGAAITAGATQTRYYLIDWQTGSFYEKP